MPEPPIADESAMESRQQLRKLGARRAALDRRRGEGWTATEIAVLGRAVWRPAAVRNEHSRLLDSCAARLSTMPELSAADAVDVLGAEGRLAVRRAHDTNL